MSSMPPEATAVPVAPVPTLSPLERAVRIFVRPAGAWDGLEARAQWWIPLLVSVVLTVGLVAASYHRVIVPMMMDQWDEAISSGRMQPEQVDKAAEFMQHNPLGMAFAVGPQLFFIPIVTLLLALVLWFAIGFVLGGRFRYRLALEVVCWASLIRIPETIVTTAIAWGTQTYKGIHLGLGALLPEADPPTKLHAGLAVLLDAIGPFGLWYMVVVVLGSSALSGVPRKNAAWILGGLYLALAAISALVAALFTPGS